MEKEFVNAVNNIEDEEINAELFELPPLKEMNDIISEFEKSGMADEPSIFDGIESELEIDEQYAENTFDIDLSGEQPAEVTGESFNEGVTNIMLVEKDIPEIDFGITKDIFDEVKIKEKDISYSLNRISLSHSSIGKEIVSFTTELKQNDTIFQDCMEHETVQYQEKRKEDEYSINEDQCILKINDYDTSTDKNFPVLEQETATKAGEENMIMSEINNHGENEMDKNFLNSKEGLKNFAENVVHKNFSLSKKDVCEIEKKNAEILIDEELEKTEENIEPSNKTALSSIDEVIESVVKASAELCNVSNEEVNKQIVKQRNIAKKSFQVINDDKLNNFDYKKIPIKKRTHGLFEVVVPLIGKNVMEPGNDTPFNHRYDLAKQRNILRAKCQQKMSDFPIPSTSYREWRRQKSSRSKEQIEREEQEETLNAMQLATAFTKIAIKILNEYRKDQPNEAAMIKYFGYFECAPASPLSLLYAPHFVHTVMLCRGDEDLSFKLRRVANDCYEKCHALFAIPEGYNFETVYTSEVKKNIPDEFDHLNDLELNYGDYDSSDFEDVSQSASESDGKENWE